MNLMLGVVASSLAILMVSGVALVAFHNWAYKAGIKKGYAKGYELGRREADNWWVRAESEIDQARAKIWREEEKRG